MNSAKAVHMMRSLIGGTFFGFEISGSRCRNGWNSCSSFIPTVSHGGGSGVQ